MRTSRISRETAKIVSKTSLGISRRQTRSIGTSLQRSTVTENTSQEINSSKIKQEDDGNDNDDSSSLSSLASTTLHDIEDFPSPVSHTRKRKRSLKPITDITTSNITRISPRKPNIKDEDGPAANTKKARRQPAKQVVNGAGEVEVHPPANWEKIYEAVREMRKHVLAPVDTMGCETLAEDNLSPRVSLYHFIWLKCLTQYFLGQTLSNIDSTYALLPDQRHHKRHCHASTPRRASFPRSNS